MIRDEARRRERDCVEKRSSESKSADVRRTYTKLSRKDRVSRIVSCNVSISRSMDATDSRSVTEQQESFHQLFAYKTSSC
jgi:hypothetical protein